MVALDGQRLHGVERAADDEGKEDVLLGGRLGVQIGRPQMAFDLGVEDVLPPREQHLDDVLLSVDSRGDLQKERERVSEQLVAVLEGRKAAVKHFVLEEVAEFDALVLIGTGEFELIGNLYTVEAAQHSERLSHIVFIGGQSLEAMRTVPTVAPKLVTEWALAEGRKPYTSLRPSTFMQNDLMMRPLIAQGRYIGGFGDVGVARLDLRDLADAVVACLGTPATFGQTYTACGPDNLTTAAIVQAWSTALGRPVEPLAMSPAAFPALPPSGAAAGRLDESPAGSQILHHSLELQFMAYRRGALLATAAEVERFAALIGHPPRTFADFTR